MRFVKDYWPQISNVGTLLEKATGLSRFEQLFSAGIRNVSYDYPFDIHQTPKWLVKFCRESGVRLDEKLYNCYTQFPSSFQIMYDMQFQTMNLNEAVDCLIYNAWSWRTTGNAFFKQLCEHHGYTPKPLLNYIDYLMTYEALEQPKNIMLELFDYATMMHEISEKFDKYPRNFLTTSRIASRNYSRLIREFEESKFERCLRPELECRIGDYNFIYPKTTQDIKDEAVQQNNCVASYIQRVIDGECHIMFMRKADEPEHSLVTLEIRDDQIVQALQRSNAPMTPEQKEIVDKWNNRHQKKKEMAIAC